MGSSEEEFLRLLPSALGVEHIDAREQSTFCIRRQGKTIKLAWRPLSKRKLGVLILPRLEVVVELEGFSPSAATNFFTRFDHHFRRGGG